jgi:hypothetical protein
MAVELKHATQAVGVDAGNGEIRKLQWNENHALTGAPNTVLTFDGAGAATETPISDFGGGGDPTPVVFLLMGA